jgi:hypothetical protein
VQLEKIPPIWSPCSGGLNCNTRTTQKGRYISLPNVVLPNVILPNVILLNVILPNVILPKVVLPNVVSQLFA